MDINSTVLKDKLFRRIWGMLPALFLVLIIIVIVVMFSRIKGESERIKAEKLAAFNKERPPVNVVVLDIIPMPIRDRLNLPSQVEPWVELKILAEVSGKVISVSAAEGSYVRKGDIIALLDSQDYENELASIRSQYELAQKNLSRSNDLFKEELIAKAILDKEQSTVDALSASMKNVELRLQRCTIKAPISGIINRLDAKEGLNLNVQDSIAVIIDISRVKVNVGIPESDVDEIRKLQRFDVTIDALGSKTVKGRKIFLSKNPESFAHLYKLEIEVQNPDGAILPGMFGRVSIVKKEVKDSVSVPLYSVISRGNEQFVFVEKDGKAHVRMVETGILEGWRIQISRGLKRGDRVVVVGHRSLDEGQKINVVRNISDPEDLFK
ncbi:MAG: efflux RND transporter periplasmic adaptor subunit [Deltaproteobacteria bacterium]|nr:efflux RND transporter periplasmic adaptor subunit [Deltaproteobacteria bacterium]